MRPCHLNLHAVTCVRRITPVCVSEFDIVTDCTNTLTALAATVRESHTHRPHAAKRADCKLVLLQFYKDDRPEALAADEEAEG